jgi:hypothetical protein
MAALPLRATLSVRGGGEMSTISHEPLSRKHGWTELLVAEAWASLAISVIWLSVLFTAIWGPDFESVSAGGNRTTIPSAVIVSIFAFCATWVIAKRAFGRGQQD